MSDVLVVDAPEPAASVIERPSDVLVFEETSVPVSRQAPGSEDFFVFDPLPPATSMVTAPQDFLLVDAPAAPAATVEAETGADLLLITSGGPAGPRGLKGDKGDQGDQGPRGLSTVEQMSYVHRQDLASDRWLFEHPLAFLPNVTIRDSANNVAYGDVRYPSPSTVEVEFSAAFSGEALLS